MNVTKRELCACVLALVFALIIFRCTTETSVLFENYAVEIPCALGMLCTLPFLPKTEG